MKQTSFNTEIKPLETKDKNKITHEEASLSASFIKDKVVNKKTNTLVEFIESWKENHNDIERAKKLESALFNNTWAINQVFPDETLAEIIAFSFYGISGKVTEQINISKLKVITHLDGTRFSNKITSLAGIEFLENLQSVNLQNVEIDSISEFSGLKKIESIELRDSKINSIYFVENAPKLKTIILQNCNIKNIGGWTNVANLKKLDLQNNKNTNPRGITSLSKLECLNLIDNGFSDWQSLKSLNSLKKLQITGHKSVDLSALLEIKSLKIIIFKDDTLKCTNWLQIISSLEGFENDIALSKINEAYKKETLVFSEIFPDKNFAKIIAAQCNISNNKFTLADLSSITELNFTNIGNANISIEGAELLLNLRKLKANNIKLIKTDEMNYLKRIDTLELLEHDEPNVNFIGKFPRLMNITIKKHCLSNLELFFDYHQIQSVVLGGSIDKKKLIKLRDRLQINRSGISRNNLNMVEEFVNNTKFTISDFFPDKMLANAISKKIGTDNIYGKHLEKIWSIGKLELDGALLYTSNFKNIKRLKMLREITINNAIDLNVLGFCGAWQLKILKIRGGNIEHIECITRFKKLEKLSVTNTPLTKTAWLKELPSLKYLDISNNNIRNISFINSLPKLSYLNIIGNDVSYVDEVFSSRKINKFNFNTKYVTKTNLLIKYLGFFNSTKTINFAPKILIDSLFNKKWTPLQIFPDADFAKAIAFAYHGVESKENVALSVSSLQEITLLKLISSKTEPTLFSLRGIEILENLQEIELNNAFIEDRNSIFKLKETKKITIADVTDHEKRIFRNKNHSFKIVEVKPGLSESFDVNKVHEKKCINTKNIPHRPTINKCSGVKYILCKPVKIDSSAPNVYKIFFEGGSNIACGNMANIWNVHLNEMQYLRIDYMPGKNETFEVVESVKLNDFLLSNDSSKWETLCKEYGISIQDVHRYILKESANNFINPWMSLRELSGELDQLISKNKENNQQSLATTNFNSRSADFENYATPEVKLYYGTKYIFGMPKRIKVNSDKSCKIFFENSEVIEYSKLSSEIKISLNKPQYFKIINHDDINAPVQIEQVINLFDIVYRSEIYKANEPIDNYHDLTQYIYEQVISSQEQIMLNPWMSKETLVGEIYKYKSMHIAAQATKLKFARSKSILINENTSKHTTKTNGKSSDIKYNNDKYEPSSIKVYGWKKKEYIVGTLVKHVVTNDNCTITLSEFNAEISCSFRNQTALVCGEVYYFEIMKNNTQNGVYDVKEVISFTTMVQENSSSLRLENSLLKEYNFLWSTEIKEYIIEYINPWMSKEELEQEIKQYFHKNLTKKWYFDGMQHTTHWLNEPNIKKSKYIYSRNKVGNNLRYDLIEQRYDTYSIMRKTPEIFKYYARFYLGDPPMYHALYDELMTTFKLPKKSFLSSTGDVLSTFHPASSKWNGTQHFIPFYSYDILRFNFEFFAEVHSSDDVELKKANLAEILIKEKAYIGD